MLDYSEKALTPEKGGEKNGKFQSFLCWIIRKKITVMAAS